MKEFWNDRFDSENYVYGEEPNRFFMEQIEKINGGRLLLPGEGEGRNAVFAATRGFDVSAVDFSVKGREKALKLAEKKGVKINYKVEDLSNFHPPAGQFDLIAIIHLHLLPEVREKFHRSLAESLKPGGRIIMEVFEKEQIKENSGGPRNEDMLYSLEDIFTDFQDLDPLIFLKDKISLNEGDFHNGEAHVIRYTGIKPLI